MSDSAPRRFVRLFKPQFAELVRSGRKRQTVRPTPKRMPAAGDFLSLRVWTGKPYRSAQAVLAEVTCGRVEKIRISAAGGIDLNGQRLNSYEADRFAQGDGFIGFEELAAWFEKEHGLPFDGIVIYW
jgi:hypothetical protein